MEKVYINCFYYSFWIDKSELSKYNLTPEILNNKTDEICKTITVKKCHEELMLQREKERKEKEEKERNKNYLNMFNKINKNFIKLTSSDKTSPNTSPNSSNYPNSSNSPFFSKFYNEYYCSQLYFKFITEQLSSYKYFTNKHNNKRKKKYKKIKVD
jgi:hypothetical protein